MKNSSKKLIGKSFCILSLGIVLTLLSKVNAMEQDRYNGANNFFGEIDFNTIIARINFNQDHLIDTAFQLLEAQEQKLAEDREIAAERDREYQEALRLAQEAEQEEIRLQQQLQQQQQNIEFQKKNMEMDMLEKKARFDMEPIPLKSEHTTEIAVRFPSGRKISRRFLKTDTLQRIYDFVDANQCATRQYELHNVNPRYAFTEMDKTLEQLGLINRLLIISSRN